MPLVDASGNYVTQSVAGTPGFTSLAAVSAVQAGAVLNGLGCGTHSTLTTYTVILTATAGARPGAAKPNTNAKNRITAKNVMVAPPCYPVRC
jgi:hypothetical protein